MKDGMRVMMSRNSHEWEAAHYAKKLAQGLCSAHGCKHKVVEFHSRCPKHLPGRGSKTQNPIKSIRRTFNLKPRTI